MSMMSPQSSIVLVSFVAFSEKNHQAPANNIKVSNFTLRISDVNKFCHILLYSLEQSIMLFQTVILPIELIYKLL